jgi:hypothetical protein
MQRTFVMDGTGAMQQRMGGTLEERVHTVGAKRHSSSAWPGFSDAIVFNNELEKTTNIRHPN